MNLLTPAGVPVLVISSVSLIQDPERRYDGIHVVQFPAFRKVGNGVNMLPCQHYWGYKRHKLFHYLIIYIHEKNSQFWLAKSSAMFRNTAPKNEIQCKKYSANFIDDLGFLMIGLKYETITKIAANKLQHCSFQQK